jgi:hypothetical protein
MITSSLIYATGFEASDGFSTGPVDGQGDWSSVQGSAFISTQDSNSGLQSLILDAGPLPAVATLGFPQSQGEGVEFCDFYAKPAAEAMIANSTLFTVEGAQFAFIQSGSDGVLEAYQGDGNGGGFWVATQFVIDLGTGNQSQDWIRLTARMDFTRQTWDLYANGAMVAADIPFASNSSTYLSMFQVQGDAGTASYVDDLYVGSTNPLFADVNNDGIDDAWETQYGLSLATNDRYTDPSGGGVSNVQKYVQGTNPLDYFNGIAPNVTPFYTDPLTGQGVPGPNNDLAMMVTMPDGTPWANVPVVFEITSGTTMISAVQGVGPYVSTLTVISDSQGVARVYLQPVASQ